MLDWYYPYGMYYPSGYGYQFYYDQFYLDTIHRESTGIPEVEGRKSVLETIRKAHLKKQDTSPYPLPKALKQSYKKFVSALKEGDERVIASVKNVPEHFVFVKNQDLNSPKIQEKILKFEQMEKQIESYRASNGDAPLKTPQNPYTKAVSTFKRNAVVAQLRAFITSSITKEKTALKRERNYVSPQKTKGVKSPLVMRFRDWNPDVKKAQRLGVEIKYSSKANEVRCPALGLSSRNVTFSRAGSISSAFHSSGSSSGKSSSSGSSGGSSRTGSASSAARSSSGGGGHKK